MRKLLTIAVVAMVLSLGSSWATAADGRQPRCKGAWSCACQKCQQQSWNQGYYHPAWGMPIALVVPPTAEMQTNWGWGVANTRVTAICPQFKFGYPGPGYYHRANFAPTPPWPSDTTQFGVYYVRGPW